MIDALVCLYLLLIAPKLLFDRILKGKRHPGFLQRLGFGLPKTSKPLIWIHAISVGEVKSAQPLFQELKHRHPHSFFYITTTTATGQEEAKRSLSAADAFGYLPIDLSFVVKRVVKQLNPTHFILIESDFWIQLLTALKQNGTRISLVSGKLSAKSARRLNALSFFAHKLFSHFNQLCVQNEEHYHRFLPLLQDPTKLAITGNLKLDLKAQPISQKLSIPQPAITIACTHFPEEERLLDILIDGPWSILLAPRHPERFDSVAQLLEKRHISFGRLSRAEWDRKVLLIDQMGQLPLCYSHSRLAILGGSFVDHIGGHNVLEPCLYGIPVFFGPHMFGQTEFAKRVLEAGAGRQLELRQVKEAVVHFFLNPEEERTMKAAIQTALASGRGATERTLAAIF